MNKILIGEIGMKKSVLWLVETALMLAMLVALQAVTKPMGQLVTGSCVNLILAITVLVVGCSGGLTVALLSPVFAFLLNIAPNIVTVIPIMVGNAAFVVLLKLLYNKALWQQILALAAAAAAKFALLYFLVVKVICEFLAPELLMKKIGDTIILAPKMTKMLPTMFSWTQLFTALIGGAVALLIYPTLKKALRK